MHPCRIYTFPCKIQCVTGRQRSGRAGSGSAGPGDGRKREERDREELRLDRSGGRVNTTRHGLRAEAEMPWRRALLPTPVGQQTPSVHRCRSSTWVRGKVN